MAEIFNIGEFKLYVSKEHRFGTDAVKLAEFTSAQTLKSKMICDLCTGCGIIPFLLLNSENENNKPAKIYALDINAEATELLQKSIEANLLSEVIVPVCEDLKHLKSLKNNTQIPAGSIDIVTVNPPYFKANDGFKREKTATARHELLCNLDDVTKASSWLLKYGGRLKMCHLPERLADVVETLRKYDLEPKIIEFVTNGNGRDKPWLMLIDAKKGGKAGVKVVVN
ncbi:MAG: methyltransferase [Oscillospiraceae bacterium]|nr:methyltransferase [Oscillospiraceae bacterium]